MRGLAKVPSVLGGYRPVVRDAGAQAFQQVQWLKGQVATARTRLENLEQQLAEAEEERNAMRDECGKCGDCSACIG